LPQAPHFEAQHLLPAGGQAVFPPGIATFQSPLVLSHQAAGQQAIQIQFLQQYAQYYFSPLRIKLWGARRDGFHELDSYSKEEINQGLQRLFVANKVRTKISKKGNTLYGIL
jgi:hypothetical protein